MKTCIFGTTCVCEFTLSNMNFMISKNNSSISTENLAPKMRYDVKYKEYTIYTETWYENECKLFYYNVTLIIF